MGWVTYGLDQAQIHVHNAIPPPGNRKNATPTPRNTNLRQSKCT